MNKRTKVALFLLLMSSFVVQAEELKSEVELWNEVFQKSYQKKFLDQEKEANQEGLARAKRHWLPRAYVSGQWFRTNDPTQVFFNNLGQRSIQGSDFTPADLNRPGIKNFRFGSLGLDLPLFEGGLKSSQTSMFDHLVQSSDMERVAKKSEEYGEFSRQFGTLLITEKINQRLNELKIQLTKVISQYQVGSQSNPLGYSGLLGLRGVENRITGLLSETDLKRTNARNWINSKRQNQDAWKVDHKLNLVGFIQNNLTESANRSYSSLILAQELKVRTLENMKEMEKARFLPRVGLFAQNNIYSGERDSATSQSYGIYLMWDLFNSDSYGRVSEANAKAMASEAKMEAHKQEERIMLVQLSESKITLEKKLTLLEKSDQLLNEQTINAMKLFRSGLLNALQLAEVINRRVDLLENKSKAESQFLDVNSRLYQIKN